MCPPPLFFGSGGYPARHSGSSWLEMWSVLLFISYIDLAPAGFHLYNSRSSQYDSTTWQAVTQLRLNKMDLGSMLPDDMGIGEGDKTVQLVLIYSAIAILYLVVAYIMFFRSFFSAVLPFSVWSTIVQEETQRGKRRPSQKGRRGKENGRTKERQENEKEGLNAQTSHLS